MQLFVRGLETVETLEVQEDVTIAAVKAQLAHLCRFKEFVLSCEGIALNNEVAVSALSSNELDITIPMLGGKVHGSLARAGKVKGQTPKVEKQEKKKKLTGRAKKRMQYNRRFANVVEGFGPRRGPNSNST